MTAICSLSNAQAAPNQAPVKGGLCYGTPQALNCEHLGKVTVRRFTKGFWRVVAYVKEGPSTVTVVIEEQR